MDRSQVRGWERHEFHGFNTKKTKATKLWRDRALLRLLQGFRSESGLFNYGCMCWLRAPVRPFSFLRPNPARSAAIHPLGLAAYFPALPSSWEQFSFLG